MLTILTLCACTTGDSITNNHEENERKEVDETDNGTYPLVINNVYLASEDIIDHKIILLIEVTNVSDEEIAVGKTDFSLRHKSDESIEFNRVQWDGEEIMLKPMETNILFNFQAVPDHFDATSFNPNEFQVTYTGIHYDNHPAMQIQTKIPERYQDETQITIAEFKQYLVSLEADELDENYHEVESDPIRITLYELNTDGSGYIRVENLTDDFFYFEPRYVRLLDLHYEYEVDSRVRDSAIDNGLKIPPHGKVEYREFFYISGEFHPESDYIVENVIGVRYKTEWPMAKEYDILGRYENELPDDFTMEN